MLSQHVWAIETVNINPTVGFAEGQVQQCLLEFCILFVWVVWKVGEKNGMQFTGYTERLLHCIVVKQQFVSHTYTSRQQCFSNPLHILLSSP